MITKQGGVTVIQMDCLPAGCKGLRIMDRYKIKHMIIALLVVFAAVISSPALASISFVGSPLTGAATGAGTDVSAGAGRGFLVAIPPDGTLTSMSIPRPTGVQVGDALVSQFIVRPQGTNITSPSGWSQLRRTTQTQGGTTTPPCGLDVISYFKIVQAGDLGVVNDTWYISYPYSTSGYVGTAACPAGSANTVAIGGTLAFRGQFPLSPVYYSGEITSAAASISQSAPSVNVGVNNTMIVSGIGILNSDPFGNNSGTNPVRAGGVEITQPVVGLNQWASQTLERSTNATGLSLQMAYFPQTVTGATGTVTATITGGTAADFGVGHIIAISEASSPIDLKITKTANVTTSPNQVIYTISAKNNGTQAEPGPMTVTDTLTSELTYVSGAGTGWACTKALQTITCKLTGPLNAGATSAPLTITTSYSTSAVITNCASLTGQYGDNNFADNTACVNSTIGSATVYSGKAYNDANRDSSLTGGENGLGQNLYVKITTRTGSTCNSPAIKVATTDAVTGNYAFNVANGNYCIILSTNNNLSDITATVPASYINTETPTGINNTFVAAGVDQSTLNFGLYQPANIRINNTLPTGDTGLFNLSLSGGTPSVPPGSSNPASNVGNNGTTNYIYVSRGAAITVQETAGTSTNLANYATALSCTLGDGTTAVSLTSSDLTNNTTRSGTFTAPAAGQTGAQSQVICSFTNTKLLAATKSFSPSSIGAGGTSQLSITLQNPNAVAVTGAGFTDNYGFGTNLVNSGTQNAIGGTGCTGTLTGVNNGQNLTLAGATIPAGTTCTYSINVASPTAGSYLNSTGAIATGNAGTTAAATATLTVLNKLIATKSFTQPAIGAGDTSLLSITLQNPNAVPVTGVGFTDNYGFGTNLVNSGTQNAIGGTGCTGTLTGVNNGQNLTLAGATIPAVTTCSYSINVTSPTAGSYPNSTGGIATGNAGTTAAATATLTVLNKPSTSKSFNPPSIGAGDNSTMTITINNSTNATTAVNGIAFTDIFPVGMTVSNAAGLVNGCGGTITDAADATLTNTSTSLKLAGGTVNGGVSCSITIPVTAPVAAVPYTNSTGTITTTNAGNLVSTSNNLSVRSKLVATKSFSANPVGVGDSSTMTITLQNINTTAISGVAFSDDYAAQGLNLVNAAAANAVAGAGCLGTLTGANGGTSLVLSGATVPAGIACSYSISIKGTSAGSYSNSTGTITSAEAGSTAAVTATLDIKNVVVTKTYGTTTIPLTGTSILTFILTNGAGGASSPAQANLTFTDTLTVGSGLTVLSVSALSGSGCSATVPTFNSSSDPSVTLTGATMASGTITCTFTATVRGNTAGTYLNDSTRFSGGPPGIDYTTASSTLTVSAGTTVSGTVYSDANHNAYLDGSESGTGQTLYVKLLSGGCSGTFVQAVAATPGTGAYSLPGVSPGSYCLLLSTNNLSDASAGTPSAWLALEGAGGELVSVTATPASGQNFGIYNGSKINGRVFADIGTGAAANNGAQEGGEPGISGVSVKATDNSGATIHDAAGTNGNGDFILWVPASAGANPVKIVESNSGSYISTGGAAGTTGGSYDRSSDTISFTNTVGTSYSGLLFADVPDNRFQTDNAASALPGTVMFYSHSFTAGSGGSVTFSSTAAASPAISGWNEVFYRDLNCNGTLDSGEQQITSAVSLAAAEQLCIIVKEFVPANASVGAANLTTTTATFSYSNAGPALSRGYSRTDLTTVSTSSGAGLTLTKSVDKLSALPGDAITYTITYGNNSSGPLSNMIIHDSVPAFTISPLACCVNPSSVCLGSATASFPASVSACSASIAGESITWTLTGTLAPGAAGKVKFGVTVQP